MYGCQKNPWTFLHFLLKIAPDCYLQGLYVNHIELFSGCGGLSLGLEKSGFELTMANEISPMAAESFAYNFYDENLGIAFGGDYTKPDNSTANKAITKDGGKTWKLLADGKQPGYKSCVQFVPGSEGKEIVAVGFTGISYSSDMGESWKKLSNESFYTVRFQNDSVAYAAGKNRIAKLVFK